MEQRKLFFNKRSFVITGSSGFIGFFLSKKLLDLGMKVIGFDNLNEYYDIKLKKYRLSLLKSYNPGSRRRAA